MIKDQNKLFKKLIVFSDLSIVTVSLFLSYLLRENIGSVYPFQISLHELYPIRFYIGLLPMLLLIWTGLLFFFGMYRTSCIKRVPEALLITFKTAVIGFILFGSYVFILRIQEDVSRLVIGFTFVTAAALIVFEKVLLAYLYRNLSKRTVSFKGDLFFFKNLLIVGTGERTSHFIELINKNPDLGVRIVGLVDKDYAKKGETINGYKVLGVFADIPEIIHKNVVNEVAFIVPHLWLGEIEDIMYFCESEGLTVNLAVDLFEFKFSKAKQTDLHGFPMLTFESTSDKVEHLFIKRVLDFVVSGIALIVLCPLIAAAGIIIKLTSKGAVFFKQERCSLNGKKFSLYKFRTMVFDAESQLDDVLVYNEMKGPAFKMSNDPRMTKAGKWLRKLSLDELPQLWNVFKGDMSLVGPRPPLPSEVEEYNPWQRRRLSMRPGITCLWQVSGRNLISSFDEWMRLDLEYIDNWSLKLDFEIILKTIPAVLFGKGAR